MHDQIRTSGRSRNPGTDPVPGFPGLRYKLHRPSQGYILVLFDGEQDVGSIDAYWRASASYCASHDRQLRGRHPALLRSRALQVQGSTLSPQYRGVGLGRGMYELLARIAFQDEGPFLFIPAVCGVGRGTTRDALRVWHSLARDFPSSGRVIGILEPPGRSGQGRG